MSTHETQPERTRLAWRRTAVAALTLDVVLVRQSAPGPSNAHLDGLAGVVAAVAAVIALGLGRRRDDGLRLGLLAAAVACSAGAVLLRSAG